MPRYAAGDEDGISKVSLQWTFLQRAIANLMKHAMRRSAPCTSFRSVHSGIARTGFPWHVVAGLGLRRLWQDQLFFLGFIVKVTQTSQILRTLVKGSTSTTLGRGFGALQCVCLGVDAETSTEVWVFRRDRRRRPYVLQVLFRCILGQH